MKYFLYLLPLFLLAFFVSPLKAQETPEVTPAPPPLQVFYEYPNVRVQWNVSGCVVYDGPKTPVVWFDESCRIGAGAQVIPPQPSRGPAFVPTAGMTITLLGFDNQFIASVTLDSRADYPYTVYLPGVIRGAP